jgi:AraC-like DNA-binding protein
MIAQAQTSSWSGGFPIETFVDILLYAGIVQGFFLALLLHRAGGAARRSNNILSVLLVVLSLSVVHSLFVADQVRHVATNPLRIKEPSVLLIAPLLYLYVRQSVGLARRLRPRDMLHLVPFFLFFAVNLPFFFDGQGSYSRFFAANQFPIGLAAWILMAAQFAFYLRALARLTRRHLHEAREELSNTDDVDLSWIRFFMAVFLALYVAIFVLAAILVHIGDFPSYRKSVALVYSVSVFVLGYKALFQKGIFVRAHEHPPAGECGEAPERRPDATHDPAAAVSRRAGRESPAARRVIDYVENERAYLDPDVTLTDLARNIGIGRNQLSEIINTELGTNFYDLINRYRVEEVKRLLADPTRRSVKIIAVAFEAGFPSKSTFNSIFKKWTGLTPSEYRDGLP